MKKLYFLCLTALIGFASFGQTTLYTESFETNTNGTNYTTSEAEFSDGFNDFFLRTDGSDINASYEVNGVDGAFIFAGQDLDGEGATLPLSVSTIAIDVTGLSNVDFAILLAEDDDGTNQDWDDADYVNITYSLDGGADQNLIWIRSEAAGSNSAPRLDTDFDGTGDGAEITSTFTEYVENIILSGNSSITFRIEMSLNSGDEDIAFDNIRVVNGFVAQPSITITSPSNGAEIAPGTTSVDVEFSTTNLSGGESIDIIVNGNTTTNVTSPFAVTTVDGQTYAITVQLVNGGLVDEDMVSFSVLSSNAVATIAELRAGTVGEVYELTGEALLTYQQSFRGQKYIEDATGAILIDDNSGIINTTYAIGDGITGITGTLGGFDGMTQFVPAGDPGVASSTGNTITPQAVTLAMLTANPEQYESELVEVTAVLMDDSVEATFSNGTVYGLAQGADAFNFRTSFFNVDYIGANVPTVATDIVGIVSERLQDNTYYLTARDADDFSVQLLSVDDFNATSFSVYPNPTSTGFVNIVGTTDNAITVSVYDILGKQVINETLTNNRVNVSALNAGIYIVKISQNDASVTKKLVIK
ncbi:T9SS type A sorting domain-containing protein [Psychroserpens burtonensis]|uniref:T9SS type A sorting domain-containing protein n=1 Tax=Psychroserpens burtonensis TaxID=49278 RepID=UPI000428F3F0|nr:T9SS type A sorting domain-containing protein [Psychroserpens burtonensis]